MFKITLDPNRYRDFNAYKSLRLLQDEAGSQEKIEFGEKSVVPGTDAPAPKVIATINDFQALVSDESGSRLGRRAIYGEGSDTPSSLIALRKEMLEIGEGKRPGEILVLGPGNFCHTQIVFDSQPS